MLVSLERRTEIDRGHHVRNESPFLDYDFETGAVFNTAATRAVNRPRVSGEVLLYIPGREIAWL